jgi:hypothetical protein
VIFQIGKNGQLIPQSNRFIADRAAADGGIYRQSSSFEQPQDIGSGISSQNIKSKKDSEIYKQYFHSATPLIG